MTDDIENKYDPFSEEYNEDAYTDKEIKILKHIEDKKQIKLKI